VEIGTFLVNTSSLGQVPFPDVVVKHDLRTQVCWVEVSHLNHSGIAKALEGWLNKKLHVEVFVHVTITV